MSFNFLNFEFFVGLDAVTGFQIMNTLKALTKRVRIFEEEF